MTIHIIIPITVIILYTIMMAITLAVQLYHIKKFQIGQKSHKTIATLFIGATILIVIGMVSIVLATDWNQPLSLLQSFNEQEFLNNPTNQPF